MMFKAHRVQEDHRLYVCSQFKGMCLADGHKFVKDKNLSFNFFLSGHSSNACPSKFTRRECKMKHHTLLQRPQKQLPDQRTSTKTHSSINSTSNKMETTTQLTTGHSSVDDGINSVGDATKLPAVLDSGSQASFRTRRCSKGDHAANSAQPNKCVYNGFFPFPKNSRLFASEVE